MKLIAALAAAGVIAVAAIGLLELGVFADEDPERGIEPSSLEPGFLGTPTDRPLTELEKSGTACERLAGLAARIGRQTTDPAIFIRGLGRAAAGIHTDSRALLDLARGGRDVLIGGGFRSAFSDGTPGQARHFAGIAVAASYGGEDSTRALSIFVRRDPANSADGRLTDEAIAFEDALRRGRLTTGAAGNWILARICRRSGP